MKHIFIKGTNERTLLFLHGTGGDESDMLFMHKLIDSNANLLSIRGNVIENGMNRFFKRLKEGVFDEEDLVFRTDELYNFVIKASKEYQITLDKLVAIGYSNGANILGSILIHHGNVFKYVALLHPMVPRRNIVIPTLSDVNIFIGAGINDSLCPLSETEELISIFESVDSKIEVAWTNAGHKISSEEINSLIKWYNNLFTV